MSCSNVSLFLIMWHLLSPPSLTPSSSPCRVKVEERSSQDDGELKCRKRTSSESSDKEALSSQLRVQYSRSVRVCTCSHYPLGSV